jgi:hypothetical protein
LFDFFVGRGLAGHLALGCFDGRLFGSHLDGFVACGSIRYFLEVRMVYMSLLWCREGVLGR